MTVLIPRSLRLGVESGHAQQYGGEVLSATG